MGWLDDIAHAVGQTIQSLANDVGSDIHSLENMVGDLASYGIDVPSIATKLSMTPTNFLKAMVNVLSGDPHAQLSHYVQAPGQWINWSADHMSGHWQTMITHHSTIRHQIDTEFGQVFQDGGTFAYSGPAADELLTTHTQYQNYFSTLIDHAQTQQTRYTTLQGHAQTFLTDTHSTIYSLPSPVAAVGVVSMNVAADAEPFIQFVQDLMGIDLTGMAISLPWVGPDIPIETILAAILIILAIIWLVAQLVDAINNAVTTHTAEQSTTTTQQPTPTPKPTPTPTPSSGTNTGVQLDPMPIPLDPNAPPRTKDEQCKVSDWASFVALFGAAYVKRIQTEHPKYGCFILKELRDIQTEKPGLIGGLPFIEANLLLAGADSGAQATDANGNTGESNNFRGSFFQLQWVHDHLNSVQDVELVGNDGVQGPDAELNDGTFVEFKDWSYSTLSSGKQDLIDQVNHDRAAFPPPPPHVIHFVFNATLCGGRLPKNIVTWLNSQAPSVTYELWTPPISD